MQPISFIEISDYYGKESQHGTPCVAARYMGSFLLTLGGRGCWFKIKNSSYKKNSYQFFLFTVGVIKHNIFYNVGFDAKYYLLTFVS